MSKGEKKSLIKLRSHLRKDTREARMGVTRDKKSIRSLNKLIKKERR